MRLPLATLPLSSFVKPASPSATLEHPPSPKKPSRLSMASNPSRTLLPSPFLDPSSAADRPGPLGTLFEVPPSPRGMMLAEEAQLEEDEFPPTPPRRLLDAFIQSAHKSPGGSRTGSASGSTSGIGSSRSRTGSPAPQSPTRRRVLVEEEAPGTPRWGTWGGRKADTGSSYSMGVLRRRARDGCTTAHLPITHLGARLPLRL